MRQQDEDARKMAKIFPSAYLFSEKILLKLILNDTQAFQHGNGGGSTPPAASLGCAKSLSASGVPDAIAICLGEQRIHCQRRVFGDRPQLTSIYKRQRRLLDKLSRSIVPQKSVPIIIMKCI